MNRHGTSLSPSEFDAHQSREARDCKPVRDWTAEERCEAFMESRKIEAQMAEAGIVEEWEPCEDCHDYKRERGSGLCKKCIEQIRQYEG
jgi:hypothetical protein